MFFFWYFFLAQFFQPCHQIFWILDFHPTSVFSGCQGHWCCRAKCAPRSSSNSFCCARSRSNSNLAARGPPGGVKTHGIVRKKKWGPPENRRKTHGKWGFISDFSGILMGSDHVGDLFKKIWTMGWTKLNFDSRNVLWSYTRILTHERSDQVGWWHECPLVSSNMAGESPNVPSMKGMFRKWYL